jgi:hypothetical protein
MQAVAGEGRDLRHRRVDKRQPHHGRAAHCRGELCSAM